MHFEFPNNFAILFVFIYKKEIKKIKPKTPKQMITLDLDFKEVINIDFRYFSFIQEKISFGKDFIEV